MFKWKNISARMNSLNLISFACVHHSSLFQYCTFRRALWLNKRFVSRQQFLIVFPLLFFLSFLELFISYKLVLKWLIFTFIIYMAMLLLFIYSPLYWMHRTTFQVVAPIDDQYCHKEFTEWRLYCWNLFLNFVLIDVGRCFSFK